MSFVHGKAESNTHESYHNNLNYHKAANKKIQIEWVDERFEKKWKTIKSDYCTKMFLFIMFNGLNKTLKNRARTTY